MAYTDKKVNELRDMCAARGLPKSGTKAMLITRLEQQQQQENFIKQEANEMQIDVPLIQQQQKQEVPTSPLIVSGAGPSNETLSHIKYEYEPTNNNNSLLQSMKTEQHPIEDLSIEQDMPSNVNDMSNEYPQSIIDPVEQHNNQQQIDLPPTVSPSVATSPIVTHVTNTDMTNVETSPSINNNIPLEQNNNHDHPKSFDSLEKPYSSIYQKDDARCEIDRELARLISERKCGTHNLNLSGLFSRGNIMNGVPYDYDLLLDIVQKSEIYKGGEIPDWFKYDYDTTFGTTYFGESECVRNIGIPDEDFFLSS
ncbi:hypothetical protein C1645_760939 [Glomus cerebriforme]|uniref:SAP domain-containing protein n=1 Tax=Glomus cerebriforme TaxID=658196 RepID=A0A397TCJ9_9GLOM|nr:hypothetical protein C1645_760939 [Glomus cerebriforme]